MYLKATILKIDRGSEPKPGRLTNGSLASFCIRPSYFVANRSAAAYQRQEVGTTMVYSKTAAHAATGILLMWYLSCLGISS